MGITLSFTVMSQSEVHKLVKNRIAEFNIPGLAFIVAKKGEIIEEGYYGKANIELNSPITKNSVFAIASMSKTFTAAAILLLEEKGQLSLDDPILNFIPEAPESWNKITLEHLLTHASGLPDDWELFSWEESIEFFIRNQNDNEFLQALFKQELKYSPGTNKSYSCGPFVLGVVIKRITGKDYANFLKDEIFDPLDLHQTFVDDPYKIIENRVSGYIVHDSTQMKTRFSGLGNGLLVSPISYGRADVGIRTSTRDLLKFYNALINGKLLNEKSTKKMFGPANLDNGDLTPYGAGWMNWPMRGLMISEHSGIFRTGFSSQVFIFHRDELVIILLTNLFGGSSFDFTQELAAVYNPAFTKISRRPTISDNASYLTKQHLQFFKDYYNNNIDEEMVTEMATINYFSNPIKESFRGIKSIEFLGEENFNTDEIKVFGIGIEKMRYYKLDADTTIYTVLLLDKNQRIVYFDYPEYD